MLPDEKIKDLIAGTLKELGRLKFNSIATRLQRYEAMSRIMRKDKVQFDSGVGIQRQVLVDHSNSAQNTGLYADDTVNVTDDLKTVDVPWRHTTANYAYERRELAMNRGESKIVDITQTRRIKALISLAELMETDFWGKPVDSTDEITPFGVAYWVVKNAATGFNGGAPTGFALGAGNLLHDRWRNFTAQYTAVTKADLIALMRKGFRQIHFESPVDIPDYREGRGDQYRIYTNEPVIEAMEILGEDQNENLGRDLASMDDTMTFRRCPIIWVPKLDLDTQNPVYMLNFATFFPVFLRGEYLREDGPDKNGTKHTVWQVFLDTSWNTICEDRRSNAVFSKA